MGLATASRLAEFGTRVMLLDINVEQGQAAVQRIVQAGCQALFYPCNVTVEADCQRTIKEIQAEFGRVDVLCNNAVIIRRKTVVELEEAEWDAVINVSLKGAYLLSKYVIPVIADNGGGSIIHTGPLE